MHPRIKARYLATLQAKRARMVSYANEVVATHVGELEKLLGTINSANEVGILKIPNEFMEYYSDTIRTLRQLDLKLIENLQLVEELLLKCDPVCTFLNSHIQLQAAKQNIELLQSALADGSAQQSNQHGTPSKGWCAKL